MAENVARGVWDVRGPIVDVEDLAFVADGTSCTVTGILWVKSHIRSARIEMAEIHPGQFAFTYTLTGTNPVRLFDANIANAMTGRTIPIRALLGVTLNFSTAVRYGCSGQHSMILDMITNKTRYPLIDSSLSNRTWGRVG